MRDLEILQRLLRLLKRVQRQRRVVLGLFGFVVEARVFFLQVAGVGKNDAAQINCWRRGVNRPAEAFFHQPGNPSAVIKMGMRQDDRIDFFRRNRSVMPVPLPPIFLSLEQSAIDEDLQSTAARRISGIDQMLRSSHGAGGAKKLDVSQSIPPKSENPNCKRRDGYFCARGPAAFTSGGASKFSKFLAKRLRKSSAALSYAPLSAQALRGFSTCGGTPWHAFGIANPNVGSISNSCWINSPSTAESTMARVYGMSMR